MFATHRPLIFYVAIAAVNALTHVVIKGLGFGQLAEFDTPSKSQSIYFRPKETTTRSSGGRAGSEDTTGGVSTTASDGTAEESRPLVKKMPIVFIHGIGIGYPHYLGLVAALPTDVDVYLVEWPNVAMQMSATGPTPDECIEAIVKLFAAHGHTQGCFVAHSLGTVMISWLLKDPRSAKLVASTVIMDPVSFLLCDPTVATNFVYRQPKTPLEFMMHYFVSRFGGLNLFCFVHMINILVLSRDRELFIANALSRHFAWSHNIMFVEDFLNGKVRPFADTG